MLRHATRVSLVLLATLAIACTQVAAPPAPDMLPLRARNDGTTRQEIEAKLQRLNQLLSTRDEAIAAEFATDADTVLMGSEASELAAGREGLSAFFDRLFKRPETMSWEWNDTRISSRGDVAWVYSSGDMVLTGPDGEMRSPYRLTGVFERRDGKWLWRQLHGSEPAKPSPAGRK